MNSLEPFQSLLQIDFVFRPVLQHHPLIFFQMRREFKGYAGSFVQLLFINLKTLKASRGLRKECRSRYLGDSQTSEWSTSPGGLLKPQWLGAALPAPPAPPQWFWLCRWRVAPRDLNLWPFPGDSDAAGSGTPLPDQRLPPPCSVFPLQHPPLPNMRFCVMFFDSKWPISPLARHVRVGMFLDLSVAVSSTSRMILGT